MQGYIYVLSNEAMPGLLKIGRTTNSPNQRMSELYTTGVPVKFDLRYWVEVSNNVRAEKSVHKALDDVRYNKEFFKCDLEHAIATIRLLNLNQIKEYTDTQFQVSAERRQKTYLEKKQAEKVKMAKLHAEQREEARLQKIYDEKIDNISSKIGWPVGLISAGYTFSSTSSYNSTWGPLILAVIVGTIVGLTLGTGIAKFLVKKPGEEENLPETKVTGTTSTAPPSKPQYQEQPVPPKPKTEDKITTVELAVADRLQQANSLQSSQNPPTGYVHNFSDQATAVRPSVASSLKSASASSGSSTPDESKDVVAPAGHISIAQFSRIKSIPEEKLISMIRDGFYSGKLVDGQWFILEGEAETASSSGSSSVGGSSGFQFRWWHLFFVILLIKIVAIAASGK